jgi:hypothetical protein
MKKYQAKVIFIVLFVFNCISAYSQNTNIPSFLIKTNYKSIAKADFNDTLGKYGSKELGIGLNIPVYTHLFKKAENKTGFYNISILNNNSFIFPDIDCLGNTNTLLNLSLGLKGIYYTGNKSLWLTRISLNFFEDKYSISNPHPRFSGTFIYDRLVNRDFSYHFGIANRYSFGLLTVLPSAGFKYSLFTKWKLILSLPYFANIQYKINPKLLLSSKIYSSGSISYFTNKSMLFGQTQQILMFRKKATTFSLDILYKINPTISLKGSIGNEGNRKILFSDLKSEINKEPVNYFVSGIKPTYFLNFELLIKLFQKGKYSIINEETLDYLDDSFDF